MNIPHPYESLYKPTAHLQDNGLYRVSNKTYHLRDKFSMVGAKWDSKLKSWICTSEMIRELLRYGILVMIRVHIPKHCHEEEQDVFATHKEVEYGYMLLGCGWCDTSAICGDSVKIEKILDMKSYNLIKDNK